MLILEGHTGPVLSVAYAPDSRTLASGGADGSVRLWDLAAGRPRLVIPDAGGAVTSLAFAPDGNTLAVGTSSCVTLWDLKTREAGITYQSERLGTYVVAFAPTGGIAVMAGYLDPYMTVWDTHAKRGFFLPRGHRTGVLAIAHGWGHPVVVSGGGASPRGELFVWDLGGTFVGSPLTEMLHLTVYGRDVALMAAHVGAVYSVATSRDDALIASGSKDAVAKLWRRESGELLHTLAGHKGTVVAVSFTPDGGTLLTADEAGTVRLWDTATGRLRDSWDWQIGRLRSVVFSPDGMTAAAGGSDHVLVWDIDALDR